MQNKPNITAFILAAGLGSRLKPWTDSHPKALVTVNGKSLLQRNVQYLQSYGITNIVINVHHFAQQITDAIQLNNGWGSNISISDETNEVLETGGGFIHAAPLFQNSETILILNCDILTNLNLTQLISAHLDNLSIATLAVTNRQSNRALLFNKNHELVGWHNTTTSEEKLPAIHKLEPNETPQPFAFSGIHALSNAIFNANTLSGKFSMIDLYLNLCASQKIIAYNHANDTVLDVGKPDAIAVAERLFT